MGVLFAADLTEDASALMLFTPSNDVSRQYNVYESYLGYYPGSSYWLDWGGRYDNAVMNQASIYIGGHVLVKVDSLQDCCDTPWSIYDPPTAGTIYVNVLMHTWLYNSVITNFKKTISFLSGPKNPANPSDDVFNNEHWPVRLETPKFTVKLSDVINGLTKFSTFDFTLFNDDGYFDGLESFFNLPSYIKKTWKKNPSAEDFITIRYGMVETIKVDDKTITVSCADLFRSLEGPVSKPVKSIFTAAVKNTDKNLPVVYGTVIIPLIEINTFQYAAGENITEVMEVYDKDGAPISFITDSNFIITTGEAAKSAKVSGNTNNKIGEIITGIIAEKTTIQYVNSFWDITETDMYKNSSPDINIAFTGGTVQNAVKQALASDMVFLIQKNDGKFTLRQWGTAYNTFNLKNWEITKFPVKKYDEAQKRYFSSCMIQYNYDFNAKTYNDVLLYDGNEIEAESKYSKILRKEFNTFLANQTDAYTLGEKLSGRFSFLKETVQVGFGHDTSEINLLDTVYLDVNINGRKISKSASWIAKEIDPAQDILTLEAL